MRPFPSRRSRPRRRSAALPALLLALTVGGTACSGGVSGSAGSGPVSPSATGGTSPGGPAVSSGASASPGSPAPALVWSSCDSGRQCARLQVPLDHLHPDGRTITLALERARATDPGHRIGSLLINPGGPGESTLAEFGFLAGTLSPQVRARFDIVGFDPRGVGSSAPVRCASSAELDRLVSLDPAPTSPAGLDGVVSAERAFGAGCRQRSGTLLPYVGTEQAARDMDSIRAAVGDPTLTYLGFSYGTLLGATYAQLFPTHVRALVLDGALDPTLSPLTQATVQAQGLERGLSAFLADCQANSGCVWKPGGDLRAGLHLLLARIASSPLPTSLAGRQVHSGEAYLAVAASLYDRKVGWANLATGLAQAERGDGTVLLEISDSYVQRSADGSYSNTQEANAAVNCADEAYPRDVAAYQQAADAAARSAPDFGRANVLSDLVCGLWPLHSSGTPHALTAAGSAPILVVGSTDDPVTPYSEAQALAHQLAHGVLLTRVGEGHTAYGVSACIRGLVDPYLLAQTVPAASMRTCPS